MIKLNPVVPITLADAVQEKICEYISDNKMNAGDPLPKEEELSKVLQVSRNILREALGRLRILGLVETRKKKGMSVAQPDAFIGLEKMVATGIMSEEYRQELLEMRVILELGMSDYIFERKNENDIKELEAIVERENSKGIDVYELHRLDMTFHAKLYEIAGNNMLKRFQGILRPVFRSICEEAKKSSREAKTHHREICKVLRHGSLEEFRQIMRKHLSVYMTFKTKQDSGK